MKNTNFRMGVIFINLGRGNEIAIRRRIYVIGPLPLLVKTRWRGDHHVITKMYCKRIKNHLKI